MKIIQSLCWFPLVLTFASTVWATSGKALIALGRLLRDSHELGSSLWIGILDSATYSIIPQLWETVPSLPCWSWRWWKAFCDPLFSNTPRQYSNFQTSGCKNIIKLELGGVSRNISMDWFKTSLYLCCSYVTLHGPEIHSKVLGWHQQSWPWYWISCVLTLLQLIASLSTKATTKYGLIFNHLWYVSCSLKVYAL